MISKGMIDRFVRNECTDEERTAVLHYFKEHPEEWDVYFPDEDWQQLSSGHDELPSSEKMRRAIDWEVRRRPRILRAIAFATAIVFLSEKTDGFPMGPDRIRLQPAPDAAVPARPRSIPGYARDAAPQPPK